MLSFGLVLAMLTEEGRVPTLVLDANVQPGDRRLSLTVNTCTDHPQAAVVDEDDTQVVVSVVSDIESGPSLGCAAAAADRT